VRSDDLTDGRGTPRPADSFAARLAAVLAGELVNKGSVIVAFVWLARTLDPAVYGEVEWALSLMMVFTLVADAGLSTWGAAEIAARPGDAPGLVRRIGALRLTLAVPSYVVLLGVAASYGGGAGTALAVYGLSLFLTPLFLQYLFNGLFVSKWAAVGNAARGLTFVTVVLLFMRQGSPPWIVAVAEVAGAGALALCSWLLRGRVLGRDSEGPASSALDRRAILARSWTIGASEVTWGMHWYAGLILLGYLATTTEAAWHSAALRLVLALHTGVWLYLYVLLPNLARLLASDTAGWRRIVEQSLRFTGWASWTVALVGTIAADTILTTIFGAPFTAAASVFQVAVWVLPVAWMSGHLRYSLVAAGYPVRDYLAGLIGASTTILLSVMLIPALQSTGTGLALLGGTIANAVAAWALAIRVLPRFAFVASVMPSIACGAGALALGTLVRPMLGELTATILAAAALIGVALVAERETAREILGALTGSNALKVENADARP
jgi:O-antigen/teichoic acid export membrane protein